MKPIVVIIQLSSSQEIVYFDLLSKAEDFAKDRALNSPSSTIISIFKNYSVYQVEDSTISKSEIVGTIFDKGESITLRSLIQQWTRNSESYDKKSSYIKALFG